MCANELRKRVLVVDDESNICKLIEYRLVEQGYEVHCVYDGAAAVADYPTVWPCAVFMDICMPLMDGKEATRKIKEMDTDARVIACCAGLDNELPAIAAGALAYLVKPFDIGLLLELIRSLGKAKYKVGDKMMSNAHQPYNLNRKDQIRGGALFTIYKGARIAMTHPHVRGMEVDVYNIECEILRRLTAGEVANLGARL